MVATHCPSIHLIFQMGIVLPHRERRPASDLHAEVNAIGRCAMLGYLGETLPNMVWSGKNIQVYISFE